MSWGNKQCGGATKFTITVSEPCRRWEFDMENNNMNGHWIGIFTEKMVKQRLILQRM